MQLCVPHVGWRRWTAISTQCHCPQAGLPLCHNQQPPKLAHEMYTECSLQGGINCHEHCKLSGCSDSSSCETANDRRDEHVTDVVRGD